MLFATNFGKNHGQQGVWEFEMVRPLPPCVPLALAYNNHQPY